MNSKTLIGPYNFFTYSNSTVTAISCFNNIISVLGTNESRNVQLGYRSDIPPAFNNINFFQPNSGYYARVQSPETLYYDNPINTPDFILIYNDYNFFTYPYEDRSISIYSSTLCGAIGTIDSSNTTQAGFSPSIPFNFNSLRTLSALSGYYMQARIPFTINAPSPTPSVTPTITPTKIGRAHV